MELFLLCVAVAFMFTSKHQKDTAQSAYKAGKEPPGLAKARLRHESGGGLRRSPGGQRKPSGKPTGHGATRLLLSQKWANGCEKAKTRADDKHRRWRAWFAEQAPQRDEAWRAKQTSRIAKSEARAEKFARARGVMNPVAARRDKHEQQAWAENARRDAGGMVAPEHDAAGQSSATPAEGDEPALTAHQRGLVSRWKNSADNRWSAHMSGAEWAALPLETRAELAAYAQRAGVLGAVDGTPVIGEGDPEVTKHLARDADPYDLDGTKAAAERGRDEAQIDRAEAAFGATATPAAAGGTTTTTTGGTVYQQGAAQLHNHADEVEGYMQALAQLGDEMEGIGWGAEVHGPLADMHTSLGQVAVRYRDLAEQVKHQGDAVNDAYDDAPWAPERAALVQ